MAYNQYYLKAHWLIYWYKIIRFVHIKVNSLHSDPTYLFLSCHSLSHSSCCSPHIRLFSIWSIQSPCSIWYYLASWMGLSTFSWVHRRAERSMILNVNLNLNLNRNLNLNLTCLIYQMASWKDCCLASQKVKVTAYCLAPRSVLQTFHS